MDFLLMISLDGSMASSFAWAGNTGAKGQLEKPVAAVSHDIAGVEQRRIFRDA
jgi:hypothetical protein